MRVLLDSDVCLDYVLQRPPFEVDANRIFELIAEGKFDPFVCSLSPTTVFYFTRKATDIATAYAAVNDILSTSSICSVDAHVLNKAASLGFSDFEDAVQCASAISEGLDAIVTRNLKDYENSPIAVYSPSEFLETLAN